MRKLWVWLVLGFVLGDAALHAGQRSGEVSGGLRVYVARHGESEANLAGVAAGSIDSPLTPRGRRQAQSLSVTLRGLALDAVYTSPLRRALETARTAAPGRRVHVLEGLKERSWGRFAGGPSNDREFLMRRQVLGDSLDGGEAREAFEARVVAAVGEIRRRHTTGAVLIVGHGGSNQQVLRALLSLTADQAEMIDQGNDEVYAVDLADGRAPILWKLIQDANLGEL